MMRTSLVWCGLLAGAAFMAHGADTPGGEPGAQVRILLEAEGFATKGGWKVDQQFIGQMGSPYLLAHGLGTPVRDAETFADFPETGEYHVYVRTMDWVPPYGPGQFKLEVDGKALDKTFGKENSREWNSREWKWYYGGKANISSQRVKVALKDQTGFEGRCDAILFSKTEENDLPNEPGEMRSWRNKLMGLPDNPVDEGFYDLVVVGGGVAGICAALTGARMGLKVALIQNRPVLGGNNSQEVRVILEGGLTREPYPVLGKTVRELLPQPINAQGTEVWQDMSERRLKTVTGEENLSLFLSHHAFAVKMAEGKKRIVAVISKHIEKNTEHLFRGFMFVDCTGDGAVGYLAGADYAYGRESKDETGESRAPDTRDSLLMGASNRFTAKLTSEPFNVPELPWAHKYPGGAYRNWVRKAVDAFESQSEWEGANSRHRIDEGEYIRDNNFRAAYGYFYWLRNNSTHTEYRNYRLNWMGYIYGPRESRRLLGDVILKQQDIHEKKIYEDALVTATWRVDLHNPIRWNYELFGLQDCWFAYHDMGPVEGHGPYAIPYRCFYSRNIENLFMAGRNISVTHVALGKVRVMATTGMMGEAVGRAAHLARLHVTTPRGVYEKHLGELKEWCKKSASWSGAYPSLPDSIVDPLVERTESQL